MNRRDFLKLGGLGVMSAAAAGAFGYKGFADDAQKNLRVGLIGTGWYGKVDLFRLLQVAPVEVVSLCDVYKPRLEEAADITAARQASKKRPRLYGDWRKMLAEKDLDLVLVGTPDHWHALPTIAAMEAGCDVWVQKPIGVDVAECRAMTAASKKFGRVTQVGLQRRCTPHLVEMKKNLIESGAVGQIGQVDIYSYYGGGDLFQESCAPPDDFDYEMWTGPAPMRPYYPVVSNGGWRNFIEYGNGTLGDMGVHMFDMARWLLGLGWPKRISSVGGRYVYTKGIQNIPDTQTVLFDYGDLQIRWNHRTWSGVPDARHPWGGYFYGTKGLLKASVFGYDFIPRKKEEKPISADVVYELDQFPEDNDEPRIEKHCSPAIRAQMKNLLDRMADRQESVCPISEGAISTICCVLGNIALDLGRTLEYDPESGTVKNDTEATARLTRAYRGDWVHPS